MMLPFIWLDFICIYIRWELNLHEDSLMKMFMATLEGDVRSWYEGLRSESLFSLTYFHTVFHEHYKNQYPSLLLVQYCCTHVKGFIGYLENMYSDDESG